MPGRIEDYGLIGDLQTAALVGLDGSIDWLEYDTRGRRQLGDTSQALRHVGLVNTALRLSLGFSSAPSCAR